MPTAAMTTSASPAAFAPLDVTVALHDPRWHDRLPGAKSLCERLIRQTLAAKPEHWQRSFGDDQPIEVACILTDDAEIHDLNLRFRGKDSATNVLSFVADPTGPHEKGFPHVLGDIIVSLDTLEREAAEQGKRFEAHASHMIVHGTLHLLGLDHMAEGEATAMERIEIEVLAQFGIGNPYEAGIVPAGPSHGG